MDFGNIFLYIHPGEVYNPMYKVSVVGVPLFHKMILIPYPGHFLSFASLVEVTIVHITAFVTPVVEHWL